MDGARDKINVLTQQGNRVNGYATIKSKLSKFSLLFLMLGPLPPVMNKFLFNSNNLHVESYRYCACTNGFQIPKDCMLIVN